MSWFDVLIPLPFLLLAWALAWVARLVDVGAPQPWAVTTCARRAWRAYRNAAREPLSAEEEAERQTYSF
jgi:hypothetical protein